MNKINYNPELDITCEDVDAQTDIQVLNQWAYDLYQIEMSIFARNSVESWKDLTGKAKRKYLHVYAFRKYIRSRIHRLLLDERIESGWQSERSRKRDRTLIAKFVEVAKRELPKEVYQSIMTIAQEEISKENS